MPCSMWDLSSPTNRLNWYPLHWECRVLTTGPPGKSHQHTSKWVPLLLLCFHRHDKTKNPAEQCTGWIGSSNTVDLWNILYPWTCPHFNLWIFYPSRTQESKWIQEIGLIHILHEGLMCRQIWEQFTNKLTRTQDSIIGLQSNKSKLLKQVDSSCWVQARESAEVAEDENCVGKLQGKSSNSVNNQ